MNNFLVIKLTDDGLTNTRIRNEILEVLRRNGGLLVENAITDIWAEQIVSNEQYYTVKNNIDFNNHIKMHIAYQLAIFALGNNLIQYTTTPDALGIRIKGRLNILNSGGNDNG